MRRALSNTGGSTRAAGRPPKPLEGCRAAHCGSAHAEASRGRARALVASRHNQPGTSESNSCGSIHTQPCGSENSADRTT
eukprot:4213300-Prymnesium_polylepis.1